MSKLYEVVKPFEMGEPGEQPQTFAAGAEWELPAGWKEIDKTKHPTLSNHPYPVFQYQHKRRTRDESGKVVVIVDAREITLPVKAVA